MLTGSCLNQPQVKGEVKMRCSNVTISNNNIQEVETKARELLEALNSIQFVLTEQEQQGLFSIIDALHWEPCTELRRNSTPDSLITDPAVGLNMDPGEFNQRTWHLQSPQLQDMLNSLKGRQRANQK